MRKKREDAAVKEMEEDVDDWMIAGINAMLDKVKPSRGLPFDLSTSIRGVLGAQYR